MLEAAPNLETSMIFTKAQKRCLLHTVSYTRRQAMFQLLNFLANPPPPTILNVSNISNYTAGNKY